MSGSGKSVALRTLEDLDYYCVDNLPAELLTAFVQSMSRGRVAAHRSWRSSIDVRNLASDLSRIGEWLSAVGAAWATTTAWCSSTPATKCWSSATPKRAAGIRCRRSGWRCRTRSRSSASGCGRCARSPTRVIDTSELNVHQLRKAVLSGLEPGLDAARVAAVRILRLQGAACPADADFVFDARCLPNPHWDPRLRPLSGRDAAGARAPGRAGRRCASTSTRSRAFLDTWLPRFESETRSYVTVAFGCTGGRHRSVYLAEKLAQHFRERGRQDVLTYHRELE